MLNAGASVMEVVGLVMSLVVAWVGGSGVGLVAAAVVW